MNDIRGLLASHRSFRAVVLAGAALTLAIASAACGSSGPTTPINVPSPVPTTPATATLGATSEATPSATITPAPSPTSTASPTATPTATPTVAPSASPTSPAAFCTGSAKNQAFFVEAANKLKFNVYCARLGKGWSLVSGSFDSPKAGAWLTINYKGPGGATVVVSEGAFCLPPSSCVTAVGYVGPASFGGLSGRLYSLGDGTEIQVNPGTTHAYQIDGSMVGPTALADIAAALKVVPKS